MMDIIRVNQTGKCFVCVELYVCHVTADSPSMGLFGTCHFRIFDMEAIGVVKTIRACGQVRVTSTVANSILITTNSAVNQFGLSSCTKKIVKMDRGVAAPG